MTPLGPNPIASWLRGFAALVITHEEYLTTLDAAIGDADHGTNMARGMRAMTASLDDSTVEALLRSAGMTLVKTVGGAAGPLYGTLLMRMGLALAERSQVTASHLGPALQHGLDALLARGRAKLGDKTMADALAPAVSAFQCAAAAGADFPGCSRVALQAAEEGRDATWAMVARKGRASYLGVRSAGHLDPGAASAAYFFEALRGAIG